MTISPKVRAWCVDVAERVGSSFAEAVIAAITAGALAKGVNATTAHVLLVAGLTAAAATLKGVLASVVKGSVSPASLAPAQQPGQAEQDAPPEANGILASFANDLREHIERRHVVTDTGTLAAHDAAKLLTKVREGHDAALNHLNIGEKPTVVRTVVRPEKPGKGGRLGRHVHHDERSRNYRITPHPAPKTVLWQRHVKPYDQGDVGSCTGNAMAGALSTGPFPHRFAEKTAVTLYKAATRLDDVPGQYPPDDTGSSGLAVAKAAQARGWITSYQHCFGLDDVISALQDGPVIAGTNWYSGMDTPDAAGLVKVAGSVRGGHEYELVGVDLERQLVHAVNSWGTSWGVAGHFSVTFADFRRLLAEQGDVTVPVR